MEHFKGNTPIERYQNDMLNEQRKTRQLLEQIAQLLQTKQTSQTEEKRPYQRRQKA